MPQLVLGEVMTYFFGKEHLPSCCFDMDINLYDLMFPERMSSEGQEFVRAHGLESATLRQLQSDAIDLGNGMVKIFHRCALLLDNGKCGVYNTPEFPRICAAFDCKRRSDCICKGTGVCHDKPINTNPSP